MKTQFKKYWKVIVGVLFIIGGLANFGNDNIAAIFGLIIGAGFSAWWFVSRRKAAPVQESNPPAQKTGYTFVGSTDSNKYHWPTCPYAQKIPRDKQVWFKTKTEAEKKGYKHCDKCRIS